jgi:hypothetical protein
VFSINYDIIIELLLPVWLRQPKHLAFLKAVLKPLKQIYNAFVAYRTNTLRSISHTGQVIYIERLLNGDATAQYPIYLSDSDDERLDDYIYNQSEGQLPIYLYQDSASLPVEVKNEVEYENIDDFVVKVPEVPPMSDTEIRNIVEKYKPAGKRYSIQTYIQIPPP